MKVYLDHKKIHEIQKYINKTRPYLLKNLTDDDVPFTPAAAVKFITNTQFLLDCIETLQEQCQKGDNDGWGT